MNKILLNKNITIGLLTIILLSMGVLAADFSSSASSMISVNLINQNPDPANAGDIVEVRVGLENLGGGTAENLMLEFDPSYPFEKVPGEELVQDVGSLNVYQSGEDMTILKYKIKVNKDTTAGTYNLKFTYYPKDQKNVSSITRTVSIDVSSKQSAQIMKIDKTVIVPGEQSPLTFTITNVGSAPLRDMIFSWSNSDKIILPVGSDNTKYVKYLEVGKSVDLEYQVIADSNADAGLYGLDLNLKYSDVNTGADNVINTIAGLYVGGGTDFDIAFSEVSNSQTSFTIANTGSNPAFSVSVIVPPQDGWTVSGANSMIIGNLNKGDYTVASFNVQSTSSKVGSVSSTGVQGNMRNQSNVKNVSSTNSQNSIKFKIEYTDTMGSRELSEKTVAMQQSAVSGNSSAFSYGSAAYGRTITTQQSFFSKYKWYFVILIAIIFVAIFSVKYKSYKKEKSINPNLSAKSMFGNKENLSGKRK